MSFPLLARAGAAAGVLLVSLLAPSCVQEVDPGPVVVLPEESIRYERFIQADTDLVADRVTIQAVTAYRKDVAPIVSEQLHTKHVTPDRIVLTSQDDRLRGQPVSVSFRNMRVRARERIEVVFSDVPLLTGSREGPLLLVVAEGIASFRGPGIDLVSDRIVIRNDEVKAFGPDGTERPASWPR